MEKKRTKNTPLGDKFDQTDFGFEPVAWADMEALLAQDEPKPPLSMPSLVTLLFITLAFGFVISWGIYEYQYAVDSAKYAPENSNPNSLSGATTELSFAASLSKPTASDEVGNNANLLINNELQNRNTAKEQEVSPHSGNFESSLNVKQSGATPKPITDNPITNAQITEGGILEKNEDSKRADNSTDKRENYRNTEGQTFDKNKGLKGYDNSTDKSKNSRNTEGGIFDKNKDLKGADNSTDKRENPRNAEGNNLTQNLMPLSQKDLTQNTLQSLDANRQAVKGEDAENSEKNNAARLQNTLNNPIQNTDNQILTTDFEAIETLVVTSVSSQEFLDQKVLNGVSAMEKPQIITVKNLWSGKRNWLSVGAGRSFIAGSDAGASSLFNRYRLAYGRRITPLLSLGASVNHSLADFQSHVFVAEAEAQLFLINRRRFEMAVSFGYGFRNWEFNGNLANGLKKSAGTDNGFTLGLTATYWFKNNWGLSWRYDLKQVTNADFMPALDWVLGINKRF